MLVLWLQIFCLLASCHFGSRCDDCTTATWLLGCGTAKAILFVVWQHSQPLCITAVNFGACMPPVARHRKHGLLYSPSMTDTLSTSVGSSMLRTVPRRPLECTGQTGSSSVRNSIINRRSSRRLSCLRRGQLQTTSLMC